MAPSRNTVNQRLSRARRRSYIASLEERLQQFEKAGVQATREVQIAAQRVVEENERLRGDIERLKGGHARIQLQGEDGGGPASSSVASGQSCPRCGHAPTTEQPQSSARSKKRKLSEIDEPALSKPLYIEKQQKNQSTVAEHLPPTSPGVHQTLQPMNDFPISPSATPSPPGIRNDSQPEPSDSPNPSSPSAPSTSPQCKTPSPASMPCTQAALIIASMRNSTTPQDIFPELGCSDTVSCSVENLRVMQMIE